MWLPRLRHNEVLGEQGALTAWGPVLVDYPTMLEFKASGFNSIEMEAGVYLACYAEHLAGLEMPGRGEMLRLPNLPQCPVSIAHYASDNPPEPHTIVEPLPWPLRCAAGLRLWRGRVEAHSGGTGGLMPRFWIRAWECVNLRDGILLSDYSNMLKYHNK